MAASRQAGISPAVRGVFTTAATGGGVRVVEASITAAAGLGVHSPAKPPAGEHIGVDLVGTVAATVVDIAVVTDTVAATVGQALDLAIPTLPGGPAITDIRTPIITGRLTIPRSSTRLRTLRLG
jgi:hypothetical protein